MSSNDSPSSSPSSSHGTLPADSGSSIGAPDAGLGEQAGEVTGPLGSEATTEAPREATTEAPSEATTEAVTELADEDVDLSFSLQGRTALITGGASGIGAAIAAVFAERGARVVVVDLDGQAAAERARELGGGAIGLGGDVSDPESVEQFAQAAGAVDVLVTCAGIVALAPAEDLAPATFARTLAINLTGTFLTAQAVGRGMLERGRGKIITIASQAASVAIDEHAAYCASKAGVLGLTRVLALEWAGRGVTVNSISPTVVLTALGRSAWAGAKGEAAKASIPTGRFALPREIAGAALFLASGAADMVNGADLVVDGGYTIH